MTRIAVLAVGTLLAAATQAAPPQYTIELAKIGGIESSVTSGEAARRKRGEPNHGRVLGHASQR